MGTYTKHLTSPRMLMRLKDFFDTLARQKPLLLILEDLHWADDLSLDLLSLLMDSLPTIPMMLVCVYRPEKEHRVWQLVEKLLTIDNLPESVKEIIL